MGMHVENVIRDGWLYTGDVVQMYEEGYIFIVDRKNDMIIASGFNIYPREIEEVLYQSPPISEAAIIDIPDEYRGETVKVSIVLKPGETATSEEITDFCKKSLWPISAPRL
jgi:long-chain acyl-CoA synthetase